MLKTDPGEDDDGEAGEKREEAEGQASLHGGSSRSRVSRVWCYSFSFSFCISFLFVLIRGGGGGGGRRRDRDEEEGFSTGGSGVWFRTRNWGSVRIA